MCGYFGLIGVRRPDGQQWVCDVAASTTPKLIQAELYKRGPDAYNVAVGDRYFFAHARLSIRGNAVDAAQPFETSDGRYLCLFNGEIYDIEGVDAEFMAERGDTQALRRAFETFGIQDTLIRLNGMFSLAIYDRNEDQLYLAVDYFGQKPLYVAFMPLGLLFGSTATVVAIGSRRREICAGAMKDYLRYGFVPPDRAIYQGIEKILPGHLMVVDVSGQRPPRMERLQDRNVFLAPGRRPEAVTSATLENALNEAVRRHLLSDHPVGISLSGGIDSSLVARYFSRNQVKNLVAFCVDDKSEDTEIHQARRFAEYNGLKVVTCDLTPAAFERLYFQVADCLDEPHSDSAIVSSAALFARARKDVKVLLSGDGGDELFQGYNRHKLYNFLIKIGCFRSNKQSLLPKLAEHLRRFAGWIPWLTYQQRRILENALGNLHNTEAFIRAMLLIDSFGFESVRGTGSHFDVDGVFPHEIDQRFYLPGNNLARLDRVSLFYGIEVRPPLLDLGLLNISRSIDFSRRENQNKMLLKRLHRREYAGVSQSQTKRGFNTSIAKFVQSPRAVALGKLGAEAAADICGALFDFDTASQRRKYNLTVLGTWMAKQ